MTDKIIGFLNWIEQYRPEPLGDDMALSIYTVECLTVDNELVTGYWCAVHEKDATVEFLKNRFSWFVMSVIWNEIFKHGALQFFSEEGIQLKPIPQLKDVKVKYERRLDDNEKRE